MTIHHLSPEILSAMQGAVGDVGIAVEPAGMAKYLGDWAGDYHGSALAVLRPGSVGEVQALVRLCNKLGLAIIPQGGNTGLVSGAIDSKDAGLVVLSLERLNAIRRIDADNFTLQADAGCVLQTIKDACEAQDCLFPLALGAQGSCQIGGNAATNAGGVNVLRYGMARDLILGLEVVLADGELWNGLSGLRKNNSGYDLKQLFIGSEGTLGIITRVVLKLFPKPRSTMAALCALKDYAAVIALLDAARSGLGPLLSAFEVMWPDYWEVITSRAGVKPPVAAGHGLYVLVEAQGTDESHDAPRFQSWLEELMERGLLADAAVAQSLAQTQAFWRVRDICAEFGQVLGPHISYDIGLAVARMDEFVTRCKAALAKGIKGCESVYYGHIGDGNLHLVSWVTGLSVEQQPKEEMDAIIYGLVREMGGSVSAEHGIGTLKKKWLGHARSDAEIALMRTLKAALDPDHLLNPGKVI